MSNELRLCPFCGNELYRSPRHHNPKAYCVTEDCYGKRMSVVNLDDPVIVAMWNTRADVAATPPNDAVLAELKVLRDIGDNTKHENYKVLSQKIHNAVHRLTAALAAAAAPARDATEAMALAGARSIGNTIHTDNHGVRARECWRAMWDARDGIVEPIPQGTLVSRPPQLVGDGK